jgi:uncharacterized protein YegL
MTNDLNYDDVSKPVIAVAVLDLSGSMEGAKFEALQSALHRWVRSAQNNDWRERRISEMLLAVVTFGGRHEVTIVTGNGEVSPGAFVHLNSFDPGKLRVEKKGTTPLCAAVETALRLVDAEKRYFIKDGRQYWRPLIWLLSDGQPTDANGEDSDRGIGALGKTLVEGATEDPKTKKKAHFAFWAIGVGDAKKEVIDVLGARPNHGLMLTGELPFDRIVQLFKWSIPTATLPPGDQVTAADEILKDPYFRDKWPEYGR